jgi:2-polyprenyl-6-hydroxyphenyl methylase/3-demethylubiquinone-9 3-methyltransferase
VHTSTRARNDIRHYDDLADEWWRPDGRLRGLRWLAEARSTLVPPATRDGAVLVDLGCGGGLLAPHLSGLGYAHVGVDLTGSALAQAVAHGVRAVRGDVLRVPLADACADVVVAGELLEHVADPRAVVAEACRLLRPDGLLVLDTINATALARVTVRLLERVPGGPPRGIHDPNLFVPPRVLVEECLRNGVTLRVRGIRPRIAETLRFAVTRRGSVRFVPTRTTAVLYQGIGVRTPL